MAAKPDYAANESVACANEDGKATVFCSKCSEFLCETCALGHRRHSLRAVAEMSTSDITQATPFNESPPCEDHNQPLTIHCKTCDVFVCTTCDTSTHLAENHHRQDIKTAAEMTRKELEHMSRMIAEYIIKQNDILDRMKQTEQSISKDLVNALDEVEERVKNLCEIINDQKKHLTQQLKAYQSMALATAKSIQKEVRKNRIDALSFKEDTDYLYKHGADVDQVKRGPGKREKFNELIQRKQHSMAWKFGFQNKNLSQEAARKMVGKVRLTFSPQLPLETVPGRIRLGRHLQSVPLAYKGKKVVCGMVALGDCLCVTHHAQPSLWLYDMARDQHKVRQVPGLQGARGMALLNLDERSLVITDQNTGGGKIHFLKVELANLEIADHKVRDIPLKNPMRISVSEEFGQLLIGQWGKMEFVVCDVQGDVLKQIKVPNTDGSGLHVLCVTETRGGYAVLVWDKDKNGSIRWLNEEGHCTHIYYGNNEEEKMKKAFHMIDVPGTEGSLTALDHNNDTLHLVDSNHRLAQYILTKEDKISRPECIYLDEADSRLYVSFYIGATYEVRAYMWPPQSGDTEITNFEVDIKLGKLSR